MAATEGRKQANPCPHVMLGKVHDPCCYSHSQPVHPSLLSPSQAAQHGDGIWDVFRAALPGFSSQNYTSIKYPGLFILHLLEPGRMQFPSSSSLRRREGQDRAQVKPQESGNTHHKTLWDTRSPDATAGSSRTFPPREAAGK